ncbi:hypothetical protein CTI14_38415 [Methylobacterium radiotolerans]|nr:hypothetical protein CTI14_38415 [Methylobacterium radiotolerans]
MRVTKVELTYQDKGSAYPGYAVTAEFKNGINQTIQLNQAGLSYDNAAAVSFASGDSWSDGRGGGWQDKTMGQNSAGRRDGVHLPPVLRTAGAQRPAAAGPGEASCWKSNPRSAPP